MLHQFMGLREHSVTRSELPGMLNKNYTWLKPSLQEWLETDGLGGFSSSTSSGIHTRRYHGWLFLAGESPGDRWLALSKVEDTCIGPQTKWELSSNLYPGCIHPDGRRHLLAFSRQPFPKFIFRIGAGLLQREIFMVRGMPGVFCRYSLKCAGTGGDGLTLVLRPLCNSRYYHHTAREASWDPKLFCLERAVLLEKHHACEGLALVCIDGDFVQEPVWYKNMLYQMERERGLDFVEDHFSPGYFRCKIRPGKDVVLWAGPVSQQGGVRVSHLPGAEGNMGFGRWCQGLAEYSGELREIEIARRNRIAAQAGGNNILARLYLAGDQFVVKAGNGASIIAGYHWFGEWGRDTFISMPGLLFTTKRFAEAKQIFMRFAGEIREGLVPNCFAQGHGAAYNSVDASLWFIYALAQYEKVSGDWEFVKQMVPKAGEIIDSYIKGTANGIVMHGSALLRAGYRHSQLTWMDACVDGTPVTPRDGFPVEVNALWIMALSTYANWLGRILAQGDLCKADLEVGGRLSGIDTCTTTYTKYSQLAKTATNRFRQHFIWPGTGLYDRLDEKGPVAEVRPNQVIAGSIAGLLLPKNTLAGIWKTAIENLLCPHGLRTLAPLSPGYRGSFAGGPRERDSAYHQGSAWPWLFGPLFDLSTKLMETQIVSPGATDYRRLREMTYLILSHLLRLDSNPCIGTVFEVASGDFPFEPGGTVSQAWSVSEITRILHFLENVSQEEGSRAGAGPGSEPGSEPDS